MAPIEVEEEKPLCRVGSGENFRLVHLSLPEINVLLKDDIAVAIFVDGWSGPWVLFLTEAGNLRAQCPTSPGVTPVVVWGKP